MGLARCLYFFKTNISGVDHIFESYFLHKVILIQINTKICSLLASVVLKAPVPYMK
jgi:hypothetical protein